MLLVLIFFFVTLAFLYHLLFGAEGKCFTEDSGGCQVLKLMTPETWQTFHSQAPGEKIRHDAMLLTKHCFASDIKVWLEGSDEDTSDTVSSFSRSDPSAVKDQADILRYAPEEDDSVQLVTDPKRRVALRLKISVYRGTGCINLLHFPLDLTLDSRTRKVLNFSNHLRRDVRLRPNDVLVLQREYDDEVVLPKRNPLYSLVKLVLKPLSSTSL